ncbi:MAG: 16S rRNA (cytosine(1402)-N(4))-methyltransferase RsmH [bacterium]
MFHEPVLTKEAVALLISDPNGIYLDGTLGGGGHAEAILARLGARGKLIGLDLDEDAIRFASKRLSSFKNKISIRHENFKEFPEILQSLKINYINGLLLDLGLSSHLIDTPARGFSHSLTGNLDMRMNKKQKRTAAEIINSYSESALCDLFQKYGEEKRARAIARSIIKERAKSAIATTTALKEVVCKVLPYQNRVKSLARIFQALRIAVNDELNNLTETLRLSMDYLQNSGRIVVLSYHSLEDRLVKDFFKQESKRCVCPPELPVCVCRKKGRLKILTRRPVRPTEAEIHRNPRSRSARLRAAEVIGTSE